MKYTAYLLLMLLTISCKKEEEQKMCPIECGHMSTSVLLSGFKREEIDTVYVRTYRSNWQFDDLVQEEQRAVTDSIPLTNNTYGGMSLRSIQKGNDYVIHIPATSHTFSITMTHTRLYDTLPCGKAYGCNKALMATEAITGKHTGMVVGGDTYYLILQK